VPPSAVTKAPSRLAVLSNLLDLIPMGGAGHARRASGQVAMCDVGATGGAARRASGQVAMCDVGATGGAESYAKIESSE
jgi:hypothetical protein